MATTDTQNERIAHESAKQADDNAGAALGTNILSNLIIIGAFGAFAVALVGFVIGHYLILVVGGVALAAVSFVWAVAAAIALWKICKSRFSSRHEAPVE